MKTKIEYDLKYRKKYACLWKELIKAKKLFKNRISNYQFNKNTVQAHG